MTGGAGHSKTVTLGLDTSSTQLPNLTLIVIAVSIAVCPSVVCLKYRCCLRQRRVTVMKCTGRSGKDSGRLACDAVFINS